MTNKFKVGDRVRCTRELFGINICDMFTVFMDNIGDLVIENNYNPKIYTKELIMIEDWEDFFEVIND